LRFADLCDPLTALCVSAERALNRQLEGGCQVPIAAHAVYQHGELTLQGRVGSPDGKRLLSANDSIRIGLPINLAEQDVLDASVAKASELGISVARELLAAGASELLVAVR
ncbi:MAG: hydroxymethylbilane synthase, partial [Pseudomonadales bacterium]